MADSIWDVVLMSESGIREKKVRVLLFSALREAVGRSEIELGLPADATGGALLDLLGDRYAAVAEYRPVIRIAVNETYAAQDVVLDDGDEVALITPVSGG